MAEDPSSPSDTESRAEFVSAIWDLRDLAYDNPELWRDVTAEDVFQGLAEVLEGEPFQELPATASWREFTAAIRAAADIAAARSAGRSPH